MQRTAHCWCCCIAAIFHQLLGDGDKDACWKPAYRVVWPEPDRVLQILQSRRTTCIATPLARNTVALRDHLQIEKAEIVAAFAGGARRADRARIGPGRASAVVAPIGLRMTGSMYRHANRKDSGERGKIRLKATASSSSQLFA